ncbi:unnamed protein product [Brassicogethes aeneus]|nr:unnamed protein product [Brassicogethes aeneus]
MAILIHGDAAFAGEGMVQESLNISNLKYYNPQGVIHVVINNQVGFTTNPNRSRSSLYASDISKILNMPIFHVNGDCPEEASYIGKVCAEYRQTFQDNCIIDVIGYRKNGHNEADEPKFTQPHMYDVIRAHPPVFVKYSKELVEKKVLTEDDVNKLVEKNDSLYESEYKKAQEQKEISLNDWNDSPWEDWKVPNTLTMSSTGITEDVAKHIATCFYTVPSGFEVHGAIQRILKTREDLTKKRLMDWAIGEAFAIGSLLKEGIHCRLSGEDVERGTFSHRHHVLHDQKLRKNVHISLKSLYPTQAEYTVTNSCLCELGLLGFELGYSLPNPNALVIWEAQFGDFANMAQPIVDTFISSGETKWVRQSGLVILLPHGMEGQGPEHSSGRIERYLELCSEDEDFCPPDDANFAFKQLNEINWIVANCTTPANIFHILRRQIAMPFRKPLVVFTPKSLLRNPLARSSFDDILVGTEFQRIIPDRGPASQKPEDVKKLIFCSGKVYYEIVQLLEEKKLQDQIAVTRIEQYCPFPFDLVKAEFNKYPKANIFYAQEEHKNQGAYHYVRPRISTSIGGARPVQYIGRDVSAAPSNGNKVIQKRELKKLQADLIAL